MAAPPFLLAPPLEPRSSMGRNLLLEQNDPASAQTFRHLISIGRGVESALAVEARSTVRTCAACVNWVGSSASMRHGLSKSNQVFPVSG